MILVDFNQVMIATLMINLRNSPQIETDLVRHMVLNTLRSYRQRFGNKYGELVLCHDSPDPWRRDVFPQYKAARVKQKQATVERVQGVNIDTGLTWRHIIQALNQIRDELVETFPYKNIRIDRAEADDIIAVICKMRACGAISPMNSERDLIISSDKDFQQLQKYPNVDQWSPSKKLLLRCKDPKRFLQEHILRGDTSDGVPNFLSADDVFVTEGKRQKPLSSKKLETWIGLDPEDFCNDVQLSNLDRNRRMVDFTYIPTEIEDAVLEAYAEQPQGAHSKLFPYFVEHKLTKLMSSIQEF